MSNSKKIKIGLVLLTSSLCLSFSGCGNSSKTVTNSVELNSEKTTVADNAVTPTIEQVADDNAVARATEQAGDNNAVVPATEQVTDNNAVSPATEQVTNSNDSGSEPTYISNDWYDIVDTASKLDVLGCTTVIHKVLAKQDISITGTLIASSEDGSIIGKASSDIVLTAGKYNYFKYYFDTDISNASLNAQLKINNSSLFDGDRNAVEMVQYNKSGDDLYVTFKQVSDNLGEFAEFKLLLYKDGKIVDTEDGYFSIYAENLNGKDTTDIAEIWVYGVDFDTVEYIFEP
jgi:hypothetical protein